MVSTRSLSTISDHEVSGDIPFTSFTKPSNLPKLYPHLYRWNADFMKGMNLAVEIRWHGFSWLTRCSNPNICCLNPFLLKVSTALRFFAAHGRAAHNHKAPKKQCHRDAWPLGDEVIKCLGTPWLPAMDWVMNLSNCTASIQLQSDTFPI